MAELWYKNAAVYCLDVKTFFDGNGDGIGDFVGLKSRLGYLKGLDIDCVWLQPFFPSPMRDNGYDVTDYYGVDPRVGTLGEFVEFARAARERGMRVMIDLVVNHTSIDHPWFQAARSDPDSPYRQYYVWKEDKPEDAAQGTVFPGKQDSTWTWDREAKAYYFHRFYDHQADLNITNPAVKREIERITGFWMQLGVTGFRIDALPFLIEHKGTAHEGEGDPHAYLRELRRHTQALQGDVCLMAEANLLPAEVPEYFSDGDMIHMSFNFWVNQHLFLALARQDATPIRKAFEDLPPIPAWCQWNNFLRSHDELDLGRLKKGELQEVFKAFGPEAHMQLYGRGIRRRLAPMLGNDRKRLELAHSLMLTLPGTPVLRYGDEIGMGDDLGLPERESVRTPMQWNGGANGGFSSAPREKLVLPLIEEGEFGYATVNVEAQQRDPNSLLNWLERALRRRKASPEFGLGLCTWIETGRPELLAHRCDLEASTMFAVHNLGPRKLNFMLPVGAERDCVYDVLGEHRREVAEDGHYRVELEGYGYRWLRCDGPG